MDNIDGVVEEIVFRNDDNGYTVLELDADGSPITVAGNLPQVAPGDCLELEGEFVLHPRFGTQFKAVRASVAQPRTIYGIIKFLGSGLIEGCGEKTASRIVEKFGLDTIEVIEKTPDRLVEVRGISPAKAQKISDAFNSVRNQREAVMFLAGFGVTVNLAMKLYNIYGASTVSTVKTNPYVLVEDVDGIGFLTADKIARAMGLKDDDPFRIRAGISYSLKTACEKEGNTYLPRERLEKDTFRLLGLDSEKYMPVFDSSLEWLLLARKVVYPFDGAIMDSLYYHTEHSVAAKIVRRIDEVGMLPPPDITELIDRFETTHGITLHSKQREAVKNAVGSAVSVITGGPGTGKTTIINCILFVLDAMNVSSILLAPTGRAAKRITEGCGRDAYTIHRALLSNEGDKFSENAVIVDEFSMVDIFLFKMLLGAMNDNAKLIVVGDADQLPSVGAGNVLRDLIESGLIPVTRLEFIYRQSGSSRIAVNAHAINEGHMPELKAKDGDFFYFPMRTPEAIADMTVELATTRITDFCGIEPSKIQVISALKAGVAGVNNLNARLQLALNGGRKNSVKVGDITFYPGDRVMHTVNNYELEFTRGTTTGTGVFNGDIGIVSFVSAAGDIEVLFEDGRKVMYVGETRKQLILSYAVTVHKSQGCEFDAIVMPVVGGSPVIMTRNLLYTAITRAKKMAVLVGDEYHIKRMVDNNYVAERFSALGIFIDEARADMKKLFGD